MSDVACTVMNTTAVGATVRGTEITNVIVYSGMPGEAGGAPTDATYLTLSTNSTLTNERVLTAGTGVSFTDGGAGSTLTISATGTGTVTSVSVVSANGFAGSVATATTTPAITLSTSITGVLKGNGTAISAAVAGTDYEVPLTFSTGLTRTVNTVTVNTSQNISKLTNLTSNGFVKTSGGDGTLSIDTNTYLTTASAASTYLPLAGGTLSGTLNGTDITLTGTLSADQFSGTSIILSGAFTGSGMSLDASTGDGTFDGSLTATTFVGNLSGNATSATTAGSATTATSADQLTNTRTIGGSNFNGTANVTSFPSPGAIGGTTPAAGTFTTLVAGSATSLLVGTAGSAVGSVGFRNATSGTATLAPPTGALGTYTVTLPNAASTLPIYGQQITYTGPSAARTVTFPDANFTAARTDAANTFTGTQTFSSTTSILVGTAGSAVGNIGFRNATSGTITLAPTTGALGTVTATLQAVTGTIYVTGGTDVAVADGGTGLSSWTSGALVYASGTTTLASTTTVRISGNRLTDNCGSSGAENEAFGTLAGASLTTANQCTFFGYSAGRYCNANANTAIGDGALGGATVTGTGNVAVGFYAGNSAGTGAADNFFLGNQAGRYVVGGIRNVLIGTTAGLGLVTSNSYNVIIGHQAGYTYANDSMVAVGTYALISATGTQNTAIGHSSGDTVVTGTSNTMIGYNSDMATSSASNGIAIGAGAIAGAAELAINPSTTTIRFDDRTLRTGTATGLTLGGASDKLGIFAATPIAKPTITGSRGGNAALANLLTQLANYGFITDSTTA